MSLVRAASRLHFGLLSLPESSRTPEPTRRQFGGVGLMIEDPGIRVSVHGAAAWSADGPLAQRGLAYAQQFTRSLAVPADRCFSVNIDSCAPEHAGLGTGTQLGLAVARAVALEIGRADMSAVDLARHIGRGKRSAIGIHGFAHGGLLVDGGKGPATDVAPLIARLPFPDDWHIVLIVPPHTEGLHGVSESQAFAKVNAANQPTDALCRLALLGILPAVAERDLPAFGQALYEFNRRVGEMFRSFQGGIYAHSQGEALAEFIRRERTPAVGQSSWGPTMFAIVERDHADWLADKVRERFGFAATDVRVTRAFNERARDETHRPGT